MKVIALLFVLCFSSCQLFIGEPALTLPTSTEAIVFPKNDSTFDVTQKVFLKASGTKNVYWWDTDKNLLGSGQIISIFLAEGIHEIHLVKEEIIQDSIRIHVKQSSNQAGHLPISTLQGQLNFTPGKLHPFVSNFDQSKIFPFLMNTPTQQAVQSALGPIELPPRPPVQMRVSSGTMEQSRNLGDSDDNQFYFPSLDNSGSATTLQADLVFENSKYQVYVETKAPQEGAFLQTLITEMTNVVLPRVEALWGSAFSAQDSSKVIVLFTPRINESGNVIGFFNPADLFPINNDYSDLNYNPGSNEAKILYLALPIPDSSSYSSSSIKATAAHEYQHLIHFFKKTLPLASLGNYSQYREELFLDEGLSHFTENLVGYGLSGGNFAFCRYYLKHISDFSIYLADRNGNQDNPGIRGAMSLYLEWLFLKNGGGHWDENDPLIFIDQGGLKFLKKLHETQLVGKAALNEVLGYTWEDSLIQWIMELNQGPSSNVAVFDPLTLEPQFTSPHESPNRLPLSTKVDVLPYSFVFYEVQDSIVPWNLLYQGSLTIGPATFHYWLE